MDVNVIPAVEKPAATYRLPKGQSKGVVFRDGRACPFEASISDEREIFVTRDMGHPWTRDTGWDGMEIWASTKEAFAELSASAERRFWQPWISDDSGRFAFFYKPAGADEPWTDRPGERTGAALHPIPYLF